MDPRQQIADLRASAPQRIASAQTLADLAAVEIEVVGRSSPLLEAKRGLAAVPQEDRPALGKEINDAADHLRRLIADRRAELSAGERDRALASDAVDVTLPGRTPRRGTTHLVQQVMDEVVDIFVSLGYTVAVGPEAETEFYNFTAMNMPYTHPARLEQDTFYLDYGDDQEGILLRTHTSPMQARYMEQNRPPVHVVVPGRVFRRDSDSTHTPVFHQIEGLAVDEDITMADLKGTLAYFAREFFGAATEVKFLPDHFPFTEPSAQMLAFADGRWLELLGCGMVNPAVFEHVGYDPDRYTGFAFGMGAERLAMVRHGIADIRSLYDPDIRTLGQFR
jgi:phenylalanyl-tRNA synthetase alpha chain